MATTQTGYHYSVILLIITLSVSKAGHTPSHDQSNSQVSTHLIDYQTQVSTCQIVTLLQQQCVDT